MAKRQPSVPQGQFAFTFDVPAAPRVESGLAGLDRRVSGTVATILKEDERDRYEVAAAMSRLLGEEIKKTTLDAYASEAKEDWAIPAYRFLALIAVTDRHDRLDMHTREIGASLLVGDEVLTAELGHIQRSMAQLKERERAIRGMAPALNGRAKT